MRDNARDSAEQGIRKYHHQRFIIEHLYSAELILPTQIIAFRRRNTSAGTIYVKLFRLRTIFFLSLSPTQLSDTYKKEPLEEIER